MGRYIDYTRGEYKKLKVSSFGMATLFYERMLEISFVGIEFKDRDKQIPDTTIVTVKLLKNKRLKIYMHLLKNVGQKIFQTF